MDKTEHNPEKVQVRKKRTGKTVTVQSKPVEKKKSKKRSKKGIGKKIVGNILLAPLLPFKSAMIRELKHRGHYSTGMNFKEIVYGFHRYVISKEGDKNSSYEPIPYDEFMNHEAFSTTLTEASDNQAGTVVTAVTTVVGAIIQKFKDAKAKRKAAKQAGISEAEYKKQVSETEARLGQAVEKVQQELEVKAAENVEVKKVDVKKFLIIGAVIAGVFLIAYFARKK